MKEKRRFTTTDGEFLCGCIEEATKECGMPKICKNVLCFSSEKNQYEFHLGDGETEIVIKSA